MHILRKFFSIDHSLNKEDHKEGKIKSAQTKGNTKTNIGGFIIKPKASENSSKREMIRTGLRGIMILIGNRKALT